MYTDNVSWKMNDLVQIRCHSEKKNTKKDNVVIKQLKRNSGSITLKIYQMIYIKK